MKTPTVQNRALIRADPEFSGLHNKKNVKSYDLTFNICCTSRTHIRTFSAFTASPKATVSVPSL